MSTLDQQVRRTRFRLSMSVTLRQVALAVLIAAATWAFLIVIERAFVVGIPLGLSAGAVAVLGVIIAGVGAYRGRIGQLSAAVVLDEAAGLKERVSTALTCRESSAAFARATVRDAEQTAGRVHVPAYVRYHAPELWPWSVATVVVAGIFFWFMPTLDLLAGERAENDESSAAAVAERQNIEVALQAQIDRVKERLGDRPALASLQEGLEKLELPDEPTQTPDDVRREAVKRIEKVSEQLKRQLRTDNYDALEQLKRELAKLQTPKGSDAASKLAEALAAGDMQAAKAALEGLKEQLKQAAQNASDPEAQRKLAEMQKKLDDLAARLAKLGDTKKLLKDLENKGGLSEEQAKELLEKLAGMDPQQMAEQLKKQLANSGMSQQQIQELAKKIAQNQQVRQQLQNMAQAMAQAAQACQQCQGGGQGSAAAAAAMQGALQDVTGQLSDLELAEQMMNELQAQLAELEDLKEGVCQGCPGGREGDPMKVGRPGPRPGHGYGPSGGKERGAHQYRATRAKTRTQSGRIIGQMLIDGPQVKGEASAEVGEAVASALRDAEDAVEREEIPRQYQRVVRYYFERLAGLINEKTKADSAADGGADADESAPSESDSATDGR